MVPGHQRPNINIREADVLIEATDHPAENLVVAHYRQSLLPHTGLQSSLLGYPAGILPGGEDNIWVDYLADSEMSRVSRRLRAAHALMRASMSVITVCYYSWKPSVRVSGTCQRILAESDPGLLGLAIFHRCSVRLCGC